MSVAVGLLACAIATLSFGTAYVPIKSRHTGDGIFSQWAMATGILLVGAVVEAQQEWPEVRPLSLLGGAFFAIANIIIVPTMSRLGMAITLLVVNTTLSTVGWACGRFGLFGTTPQPPLNHVLNYAGLAFVIIGGILFALIKPTVVQRKGNRNDDAKRGEELLPPEGGISAANDDAKDNGKSRIISLLGAIIAGAFIGVNFVPVVHMQDNPDKFPGAPKQGLPYVFGHYLGIWVTATLFFVGYTIFRKNQPFINPKSALPAICTGLLWAIAQTSFFVANENLSQTITFPIIGMMPGCLAALWSIFYFKDIRGSRNFIILAIACGITISGAILTALSKTWEW